MLEKERIGDLIIKYIRQTLSVEELIELESWLKESDKNRKIFEQLIDSKWVNEELRKIYAIDKESGWEKLKNAKARKDKRSNRVILMSSQKTWQRIAIAALFILVATTTAYLLQLKPESNLHNKRTENDLAKDRQDIKAPEKNRATITLSNGIVVYLDSLANGTKTEQDGMSLIKQADGQIAYSVNSNNISNAYNTIFNPRGSKVINLTLSDGTRVWLNSETTLRFPVNFFGEDRKVEIKGEAYFEVTKMPHKPFRVVNDRMEVEVLGTHFNLNAYPDEKVTKTTLLEGKIKLTDLATKEIKQLVPGNQAQLNGTDEINMISDVDPDEILSWKNGFFNCNNESLYDIMKQLSRWFDVEVEYKGNVPLQKFNGGIERSLSLEQVLKLLQKSGVHFTVIGKKIIVTE